MTIAPDRLTSERWDGKVLPYVPREPLQPAGDVRFFDDFAEDMDPVTYEVIRYSLSTINDEHGVTIARLSGSPITLYTNDFNSVILTARGEIVLFGPYVQWFGGLMDTVAKYLIEHLSDNPGIGPGDMFLTNDPWVGTTHQQDVLVMAPVFWEGELLCWVANAAHQYDVGGSVPGSFVPSAKDVFDEGVPLPPIKLVEAGVMRRDVKELYLRHGRRPDILEIDLHAQVAGNTDAAKRILALVGRYGPAAVNTTMERMLQTGEKAFLEKLKTIPDGEWSEVGYLEQAREGDRGVYRIRMSLEKSADTLTFRCDGTDPQIGILNTSYAAWRGGITTVIAATLAADQVYSIGGALRRCRFEPTPRTISCAAYPASVSCGGTIGGYTALLLGNNCVGKMLDSSAEMRRFLVCNEACSQFPLIAISGRNQRDEEFGTAVLDGMIGGLGAFSFRDGVDTGGLYFIPRGRAANVEENEFHFPILYLFRREQPDSGGAGRFRGGNGGELSFIPHGTSELVQTTATGGCAVPTGLGLAGGHPGCTNFFSLVRGSSVVRDFAAGRIVADAYAYGGTTERLQPKKAFTLQRADDVYHMRWAAGAGYGDPLTREPEAVAADVAAQHVTAQTARSLYGVVLSAEGLADVEATDAERRAARERRLANGRAPSPACGCPSDGQADTASLAPLSAHLGIAAGAAARSVHCVECGRILGLTSCNYKAHCVQHERPLVDANPLNVSPDEIIDEAMTFRCYYCPGCGTQVATDIARASDELYCDIRLAADDG